MSNLLKAVKYEHYKNSKSHILDKKYDIDEEFDNHFEKVGLGWILLTIMCVVFVWILLIFSGWL